MAMRKRKSPDAAAPAAANDVGEIGEAAFSARCDRGLLLKAVSTCAAVANAKASVPSLACVKISSDGKDLVVEATDLYVHVATRVPTAGASRGAVVLPARELVEKLKKLTGDEAVVRSIPGGQHGVAITSPDASRRYEQPGIPPDDFPPAMDAVKAREMSISGPDLVRLLEATVSAASEDVARPHMNGVFIEVIDGVVRAVATDGHVMRVIDGRSKVEAKGAVASAIVPLEAARLVLKAAKAMRERGDDEAEDGAPSGVVDVRITHKSASFDVDGVLITTKLTDATFPPWKQVIPANAPEWEFRVDAGALADAADAAGAVSKRSSGGVVIESHAEGVLVTARSGDGGLFTDVVPAKSTGRCPRVGVSYKYLGECLEACGGVITMSGNGALDPVKVTGEGYLAVVMPMRIGG